MESKLDIEIMKQMLTLPLLQAVESCQRAEVSRACDKIQWVLQKSCLGRMREMDTREFN